MFRSIGFRSHFSEPPDDFVFHFHRKGAEIAKKRYFSFAADPVERDMDAGKRKKSIATRCLRILNARRACFLLFSVLSTENNKNE
jgi:hypothetical protein